MITLKIFLLCKPNNDFLFLWVDKKVFGTNSIGSYRSIILPPLVVLFTQIVVGDLKPSNHNPPPQKKEERETKMKGVVFIFKLFCPLMVSHMTHDMTISLKNANSRIPSDSSLLAYYHCVIKLCLKVQFDIYRN